MASPGFRLRKREDLDTMCSIRTELRALILYGEGVHALSWLSGGVKLGARSSASLWEDQQQVVALRDRGRRPGQTYIYAGFRRCRLIVP